MPIFCLTSSECFSLDCPLSPPNDNPYGFIYIITCGINGKKYMGQKMFRKDWQYYLSNGKHFLRAIKKYGKENFSREIIYIVYSKEELNELEIMFIREHDADYYNLANK